MRRAMVVLTLVALPRAIDWMIRVKLVRVIPELVYPRITYFGSDAQRERLAEVNPRRRSPPTRERSHMLRGVNKSVIARKLEDPNHSQAQQTQ